MEFRLKEHHLMVQHAARDFANKECLPDVIRRDEQYEFPASQIKKLAELGFMGMTIDEQYGGGGLDMISYVIAIEEISKIDASVAVCMSVNNSLVCYGLEKFATEEQKKKYLDPLAQGLKDDKLYIGAFLLSEPASGSDATSQETTAEDQGDYYLLNGTKSWVTNGSTASVYIVIAQTDSAQKTKGLIALIVEKQWPGITVGKKEKKMGIRASDTHTVFFNDVIVPKQNQIGKTGSGFKLAMQVLSNGRIGIAAQALGIAAGAFERSVQYATERKAFGKEIINHQGVAFKLAEMATKIESARLLCMKAAWEKDNGLNYDISSSLAKLHASEIAMWTTVEAVQIHGGYGYIQEFHVERLMRDAKITAIYEGTSEVQKIIISRHLANQYKIREAIS